MLLKKLTIYLFFIGLIITSIGTALGDNELSATRTISEDEVTAGESFTVTVQLTTNEYVEAPAIIEEIPSGWIVTEKDTDGFSLYGAYQWLFPSTLNASESKTIVYEVTVPSETSSGEYEINGNVSAYHIYNISISGDSVISVIASSSSSSSSSGSSGGGGGGGSTTGEDNDNIAKKEVESLYVNKDADVKYEFSAEENAIEYVQFRALKNSGSISTTVEVLKGRSGFADTDAPGNIYQNVNIWVGKSGFTTSDNVEDMIVGFKIKQEWLEENSIDSADVVLYRYADDVWNKLETSVTDEDDEYVYYKSVTPGFSPFAISALSEDTFSSDAQTSGDSKSASDRASTEDSIGGQTATNTTATNSTPGLGFAGSLSALVVAGLLTKRRIRN